jgi:hypothetical protein
LRLLQLSRKVCRLLIRLLQLGSPGDRSAGGLAKLRMKMTGMIALFSQRQVQARQRRPEIGLVRLGQLGCLLPRNAARSADG